MINFFCRISLVFITISFVAISCNNYSLSEDQAEGFVRYYPTTYFRTSEGYDVIQMADGGYLIAGTTFRVNGDLTDREIMLLLTDEFGIEKENFPLLLENQGNDFGYRLLAVSDGYVIAGTTQQGTNTLGYIVKVNLNGELVFRDTIGTAVQQEFNGITESSDGGFILTGYIRETTGDRQVYLVKKDSWGFTEWERTIGFTGYNDVGEAVVEYEDRIIIAGTTSPVSSSSEYSRLLILNTNSEGKGMTEARISAQGNLSGADMIVDYEDNIIVLGNQKNTVSDLSSLYFAKIRLDGFNNELITVLDATSIDTTESLYGKSMILGSDNSIAICGWQEKVNNKDILFARVDQDFNPQGIQLFGSEGDQYGSGICITADGGYAITGSAAIAGYITTILIKLGPYGKLY